MANERGQAHQYAHALFLTARKTDVAGKVQNDLGLVVQSYRAGDKWWEVLEHPLVRREKKYQVLDRAFHGQVQGPVLALIKRLAVRRSLYLLPQILAQFEQLAQAACGIVRAQVRTAYELNENQRRLLEEKLLQFCNKQQPNITKVLVDMKVDTALMAGIAVKAGDWSLERSLRSQLFKLQQYWTGVQS